MCGRATRVTSVEEIADIFGAPPIDAGPPKYNLAPTQPMLIVRRADAASSARDREMALVRWGLVPRWAKPGEAKKLASRCVQARAETVVRAPAFRDAFQSRRCLVVVDGFYEWKTLASGQRQPHHIRRVDGKPFAIAGVWERWADRREGSKGEVIESCSVLTTASAGVVAFIHDRMPLVVPADRYDAWLTGTPAEAAELFAAPAEELVAVPVSRWVNDVRHDDPRCLEPAASDAELGQVALRFTR